MGPAGRLRRAIGLVAVGALAGGGALVLAAESPVAAAGFTVTNTADDGTNTSLRDIIQNQANDAAGDTVNLVSGATYTLACAQGGDLEHGFDTPLTIQTPAGHAPATIAMEDGCAERILQNAAGSLTINNAVFRHGRSNNQSSRTCQDDADGGALCTLGPTTITNSTFDDNATSDDGGAIKTLPASLTVVGSTFSHNCSENEGGVLQAEEASSASFTNSTVSNNTEDDLAALNVQNELTLVYTDVVDNTLEPNVDCNIPEAAGAPSTATADPDDQGAGALAAADSPSNIVARGGNTLISFGSVVALPRVGGTAAGDTPVNCDVDSTTSSGYNFSDDATCGFTNTATGDRENAGDPGLAALASNGGPTQTRLPSATSPLLNFIPIPACSGGDGLAGFAVTTDQRGILRPQSIGCEVGAVEVVLEIVLDFTG